MVLENVLRDTAPRKSARTHSCTPTPTRTCTHAHAHAHAHARTPRTHAQTHAHTRASLVGNRLVRPSAREFNEPAHAPRDRKSRWTHRQRPRRPPAHTPDAWRPLRSTLGLSNTFPEPHGGCPWCSKGGARTQPASAHAMPPKSPSASRCSCKRVRSRDARSRATKQSSYSGILCRKQPYQQLRVARECHRALTPAGSLFPLDTKNHIQTQKHTHTTHSRSIHALTQCQHKRQATPAGNDRGTQTAAPGWLRRT